MFYNARKGDGGSRNLLARLKHDNTILPLTCVTVIVYNKISWSQYLRGPSNWVICWYL